MKLKDNNLVYAGILECDTNCFQCLSGLNFEVCNKLKMKTYLVFIKFGPELSAPDVGSQCFREYQIEKKTG